MAYPARTLLRYHSADGQTHDTALVLEGGAVLHVKSASQPVKIPYDSVEAWLASLPGTPSFNELEVVQGVKGAVAEAVAVTVVAEEKKEKEKGKRKGRSKKAEAEAKAEAKAEEKKEEKETLRLIPMSEEIPSTYWTHHLHRMMKEANPSLLLRKDVIHAFNGLVEVLVKYSSHVLSFVPSAHERYERSLDMDSYPENHPLYQLCIVRMNGMSRNEETGQLRIHFPYYLSLTSDYYSTPRLTPEERGIQEEIVTAYRALFVLIRSDVVPYMNQKAKDGKIKEKKREMFRIVKRMEKEQERHEQEVGRRKASIAALEKHHEARIGNLRKAIAKLSQELDKM